MGSVVITGTSTGIGFATAKVLIKNGFRVFGSVRRASDAEHLVAQLGPKFVPLLFDVTDQAAVKVAASDVRAALGGETLAGLVNNAGVVVHGPLMSLPIEEFRRQIDVNFIGAVNTIQAFAPLLGIENKLGGHRGRIINISSVSGQMGAPFLTAYSASKFALEGLSESLRRELLPFGIEVIVIVPGLVATPIWSKAEAVDTTPYLDTRYTVALKRLRMYIEFGKRGMPPERLGQVVMDALTVPRPKVRYIVSAHTALLWIARRLPERLIDRILGKYLGLLPARR